MQVTPYKQVTDIALDVNGDFMVAGAQAPAYLIPEPGGTVIHVNGSDLSAGRAKVGPVWARSGNIPLNGTSTPIPSVGPFGTDAGVETNQFTLPPYSPLSFGNVDFAITIIVSRQPDNGAAQFEPQLLLNYQSTESTNSGFQLYLIDGDTGPRTIVAFDVGFTGTLSDDPYPLPLRLPNPSVISAGYLKATQTLYLKVNGRPTVTASLGGPNNQPTTGSQLGNYVNEDYLTFPNLPLPGQIYELLAATVAPSEAYFTSVHNVVLPFLTSSGGADLQLIGDGPGLQQAVTIALEFFLGEWFLDQSVGVPWFQDIFIKNPNLAAIQAIIRSTILAVPGITAVSSVAISVAPVTRGITIVWQATGNLGQIVSGTVQQQL